MQTFTTSDINNVRVRRRDSNRTDGACGLLVKDRLPGATVVIRLPDAAVAYADIEDARLARYAGNGAGTSATERADPSPVEGGEKGGGELGKRGRLRLRGGSLLLRGLFWRG